MADKYITLENLGTFKGKLDEKFVGDSQIIKRVAITVPNFNATSESPDFISANGNREIYYKKRFSIDPTKYVDNPLGYPSIMSNSSTTITVADIKWLTEGMYVDVIQWTTGGRVVRKSDVKILWINYKSNILFTDSSFTSSEYTGENCVLAPAASQPTAYTTEAYVTIADSKNINQLETKIIYCEAYAYSTDSVKFSKSFLSDCQNAVKGDILWLVSGDVVPTDRINFGYYLITTVQPNYLKAQLLDMKNGVITQSNIKLNFDTFIIDVTRESHTIQDKLPTVVNDRYLHTNSTTGNLEWVSLTNVFTYIGTTTTDITTSPGQTSSTITINNESVIAINGNVVTLNGTAKEFVWTGTIWQELGDEEGISNPVQDLTSNIAGTLNSIAWGNLKENHYAEIASPTMVGFNNSYEFVNIKLSINDQNEYVKLSKNTTNKYSGLFFIEESTNLYEITAYYNGTNIILRCATVK